MKYSLYLDPGPSILAPCTRFRGSPQWSLQTTSCTASAQVSSFSLLAMSQTLRQPAALSGTWHVFLLYDTRFALLEFCAGRPTEDLQARGQRSGTGLQAGPNDRVLFHTRWRAQTSLLCRSPLCLWDKSVKPDLWNCYCAVWCGSQLGHFSRENSPLFINFFLIKKIHLKGEERWYMGTAVTEPHASLHTMTLPTPYPQMTLKLQSTSHQHTHFAKSSSHPRQSSSAHQTSSCPWSSYLPHVLLSHRASPESFTGLGSPETSEFSLFNVVSRGHRSTRPWST